MGLTVGRGLSALLSAGVFAVAAHHVGGQDLGRLVTILAMAAVATVVVDGGASLAVIRTGGLDSSSRKWTHPILGVRYVLLFASLTVYCSIALTTTVPYGTGRALSWASLGLLGLIYACLSSIESLAVALLIAASRLAASVGMMLGSRLIALAVLLFFGLALNEWYAGLLCSQTLGLMPALLWLPVARRQGRTTHVGHSSKHERLGFVQSALAVQAQNLETPIVAAISGSVQAAYMGLGSRLTGPLTLAAGAGSTLVLRGTLNEASLGRRGARNRQLIVGGLTAAPLLLFAALPTQILEDVVGHNFSAAVPVLRIVLLSTALNAYVQTFAAGLQAEGRSAEVGRIVAFSVLLGLGTCAIGTVVHDAAGGALGMLSCQIVQAFLLVHMLRTPRAATTPGGT